MIRVFPRRTKWTPTDKLAFVGEPPLFRPKDQPVSVSCTFTWDIPEAIRLVRSWSRFYSDVKLGGPALNHSGGEFEPGLFIKEGVTITSRGCIRSCPFCFVPTREGRLRELEIKPGWIVQDNNLLACSRDHINAVFEMLRGINKRASFPGGIDPRLLQEWHVDLIKLIKLDSLFLSFDQKESLEPLKKAADLLSDFPRDKKRCYVLVGYRNETIAHAESRLRTVYQLGFLPFVMPFVNESGNRNRSQIWSRFIRTWSRPAAMKSCMKRLEGGIP